jgi:protein TonB
LLHVLIAWGFLGDFSPKRSTPPPVVVRVSLLPQPVVPPRLPPPPLPRFATQTITLPSVPHIAIAPPPSRDIVAATPQPPATPSAPPASPPVRASQPPPADYISRLLAHLNAYKNYPYDARLRREQGTVRLRFRMDRTGHVLSYNVVGSSGSASLDNEALAMIQRAQPLPPPPADYPGDPLDLVVPLVFSLH